MNKTQKIVHAMLTEEIGKSMLDSGGLYGYHFESNLANEDLTKKALFVSLDEYGLSVSKNVYHVLTETLQYNQEKSEMFSAWCEYAKQQMLEGFSEYSRNSIESFLANIYPFSKLVDGEYIWARAIEDRADEYEMLSHGNTYNSDNCISQDFQFAEDEDGDIWIAIHGGCDIRSGYTKWVCFSGELDELLQEIADITLPFENGYFDSYNGGYSFEDFCDGEIDIEFAVEDLEMRDDGIYHKDLGKLALA